MSTHDKTNGHVQLANGNHRIAAGDQNNGEVRELLVGPDGAFAYEPTPDDPMASAYQQLMAENNSLIHRHQALQRHHAILRAELIAARATIGRFWGLVGLLLGVGAVWLVRRILGV